MCPIDKPANEQRKAKRTGVLVCMSISSPNIRFVSCSTALRFPAQHVHPEMLRNGWGGAYDLPPSTIVSKQNEKKRIITIILVDDDIDVRFRPPSCLTFGKIRQGQSRIIGFSFFLSLSLYVTLQNTSFYLLIYLILSHP